MSNPVIFKELPATFPERDKHKIPAAIGSLVCHIALVTTLMLVPLLLHERIEHWQLMTLVAPVAPLAPSPPAPAATLQLESSSKSPTSEIQPMMRVEPRAIVIPTETPKEISRIVDDPPALGLDGVPGGVPNGVANGVLHSLLSAGLAPVEVTPPPPPPPTPPPPAPGHAPSTPVRVGGAIQEPKVVKLVPPVYPKLAIKARVKGTVILEATVTVEGTVDEIHVISGNPLLIQAAIDCVKQWRYEPTYLNGEPVPIILTARVNFQLGPLS